jgi:hypothetical protein
MSDPLRFDRASVSGDVPDRERDARIEELLLTGLDHYFAGRHELAINVWSRVLFLDRGHGKARAYIERARGAVSERQREADELFHTGVAALKRGDRIAARRLLTSAAERGAAGEEALALLHRLDRLEAAGRRAVTRAAARDPGADPAAAPAAPAGRDHRVAWVAGGILAGILIAAVAGAYLWMVTEPFDLGDGRSAGPAMAADPLPVLSPSEIRLMRARDLFEKGRMHEALAMLDAGDPGDRLRASYDVLRATIQRRLIEAGAGASPLPSGPDPR